MKPFFKLCFSRVGMVSLGILLQLLVLFASLSWFQDYAPMIHTVSVILAWAFVLYILSRKGNPAYKTAWIILLLGFPILGATLYLIFGGNRLSDRLRRKMAEIDEAMDGLTVQDPAVVDAMQAEDPDAAVMARYLANTIRCPAYRNTRTQYFSSGEAFFDQLLRDLPRAEQSIYLEYFIIESGEIWSAILEILRQKASAGVEVRLIYDDFGCIQRLPRHYDRRLEALGIHARVFNRFVPILDSRLNNRDHRKFCIIDGRIAFTGGINLADEYANRGKPRFGRWKDCGVRLEGDAVWSVTVMFLSMWNYLADRKDFGPKPSVPPLSEASGYVQPYQDSPLDEEAVGRNVFINMISRARRYIWIMTPYLIVDEAMDEVLTTAAKSGVDVRIITPGIPDKPYVYEMTRANYLALLEGGVRIFEYSPGFAHSKLFLADDESVAVGTVNLDFRSLYLHFEDGVWLYRADCVADVRRDFDETFPQCREITLADAAKVHLPRRLFRAALRLISPLM